MNEPVVTVHLTVRISAFVDAAGPQPAPRLDVWLNMFGNLLQEGLQHVGCQTLEGQGFVRAAVSQLDGGGGATRFAALLDTLAPWAWRMCVAEPASMVGSVAARKVAQRAGLFRQGRPPVHVTFLRVLCVSLSSVSPYWRLGIAGVGWYAPRRLLLHMDTATHGATRG